MSKTDISKSRIGIAAWNARLGRHGGVDVYTKELINAIGRYATKHDYSILTRKDGASIETADWNPNVRQVPLSVPSTTYRLWRLRNLFRRHFRGGDLWSEWHLFEIEETMRKSGIQLLHFPATTIHPLELQTAPILLTFFDLQHEYYPEFFTQSQLDARSKTFRPSVEKAHRLIAPSKHTRANLAEKYAVPQDKIFDFPVGVSDRFQPATATEIARVREKYQLPSEYIFYPANPWLHKNHTRLMSALRMCEAQHGIAPTLVLSGKLAEQNWSGCHLAQAAGIEHRVRDLGFVPVEDLPGLYGGALFMIFPSLFEGFGIPLLEAMAAGCPIAASNVTSIPQVTGDAAFLFDPQDVSAICNAVRQLSGDPRLRLDLSSKGKQRAKDYRWSQLIPRLEDIYSSSLDASDAKKLST